MKSVMSKCLHAFSTIMSRRGHLTVPLWTHQGHCPYLTAPNTLHHPDSLNGSRLILTWAVLPQLEGRMIQI